MKVDGSLKSLIQGVSQQPARNRLPGQCTDQINFSSNPVDGLTRRAPIKEIAELFTSATAAQFYDFTIGSTNYILAATTGNLQVFTDAGVAKTVNQANSSFAYLDGNSLAFTVDDDIIFVANRSKVVAMTNSTKSYAAGYGYVYCLGGQYGRVYSLTITAAVGTITVSYTAPDGSTSTDIEKVTSVYIATQLQAALNANGTFTTNFTVTRQDDVLMIKRTSGADFNMTVSDGDGGINLLQLTDTIQDSSKLPKYAVQGHVVSITGDSGSSADNWYAQFIVDADYAGAFPSTGNGFGRTGKWVETVAPGIAYQISSTTMPHILTYDSNTDQFTFDLAGFADRQAGDLITNENPSFIGNTIEDMFFFQGRLGFLAGPNVIMSRTNKPFDFWKNSATELADSDPIDEFSTAKGVKKMYRAIPFDRDLIIFSNKGQFIVFGRNSITPKNTSLVLTTTFEAELNATPVAAGRNIFFAQNYGKFTGIREFFADGTTDVNDARAITQQILKYLKGKVTALSTSQNFDILFVQTDNDAKTLYTYEYIWVDNKKVQSSWSTWNFDMDVVFSYINQSIVTFVQKSGTHYILGSMDLDIQPDDNLTYQVKLDRKKTISSVNTTITNPYTTMPTTPADKLKFVQGLGCPNPGLEAYVDSYNSGTNTFTLKQNMNGGAVIAGVKYKSSYIPTNPDVKDADGTHIGTGKLRVSKFILNFQNSGIIESRVFSPYMDDVFTKFTGRIVGDPNTLVGHPAIVSGSYTVPFRSNTDNAQLELFTDSFLPFTFDEIEWKGQWTKRGQRITTGRRMY